MKSGQSIRWRDFSRALCVPFLVYALLIQLLLLPLARLNAMEVTGKAASAMLCLEDEQDNRTDESGDKPPHAHDAGCCLPALRFVLDVPILVPSHIAAFPEPVRNFKNNIYILPQGRAPPAITATPAQSRAPPLPA